MNVFHCYALIYDTDEKKKDTFNKQLQTEKKDMIILVGDFNAKIATDNTGQTNTGLYERKGLDICIINNTTKTRTRYNASALKREKLRTTFHLSLSNRFQSLKTS